MFKETLAEKFKSDVKLQSKLNDFEKKSKDM